jgi:signal peptidase I
MSWVLQLAGQAAAVAPRRASSHGGPRVARRERGRRVINGHPVDEPYVRFHDAETYPADGQAVRVPAGSYFVLGDTRPESDDSRRGWFVPAGNLVGRAALALPHRPLGGCVPPRGGS